MGFNSDRAWRGSLTVQAASDLPHGSAPAYTQPQKKAPGVPGLSGAETMKGIQGSRCPRWSDTNPTAQIRRGAEPNATFRVGADGETGDFKGLTLSHSSPVIVGSRGFSLNRGRDGFG